MRTGRHNETSVAVIVATITISVIIGWNNRLHVTRIKWSLCVLDRRIFSVTSVAIHSVALLPCLSEAEEIKHLMLPVIKEFRKCSHFVRNAASHCRVLEMCQTFGSKMVLSLCRLASKSIKTSLISNWTRHECQNSWKTIATTNSTNRRQIAVRNSTGRNTSTKGDGNKMRMMNKCWFDEHTKKHTTTHTRNIVSCWRASSALIAKAATNETKTTSWKCMTHLCDGEVHIIEGNGIKSSGREMATYRKNEPTEMKRML